MAFNEIKKPHAKSATKDSVIAQLLKENNY